MKKFKSYEETIKALQHSLFKFDRSEFVGLLQSHGRILASDLIAEANYPAHPTSSMDGYAFAHDEVDELKILSSLKAGDEPNIKIGKGECIKTFTGSLMSSGSDTLIPIENVEVMGDKIKIIKPVPKGFAVRKKAESYKEGDILIKQGTTIKFAQITTLAEQGKAQVEVKIRPRVAILATGNEIVNLGESLTRSSQIRSTNHLALASIVKEVGGEPILLGLEKDDKEAIRKKILKGLSTADMVVTTGGVSVGDYDFVKDVVKELDCELIVEGSAIKPGRHIRVAKIGEKYIIALPGFTYSSIAGFFLYGVRILEFWLGLDFDRRFCRGILKQDYKKKSKLFEFVACNEKDGEIDFEGKVAGSSAIANNLLNDAVLLCVGEDKKQGEVVEFFKMSMS